MLRLSHVLLLLIAVPIAACSASPGASSAPASTAASAAPSEAPAASPSPAPAASPSAAASPSSAIAADLTTVIPTELGGLPVDAVKLSAAQVDTHFEGGLKYVAENLLKVETSDLEVVVGWGGQSQGEALVTAIRVPGSDPAVLTKAFEGGVNPAAIIGGFRGKPSTIGGKQVTLIGDPVYGYVYVQGDVAFVVQTRDPAIAEEALSALP